MSDDLAHLVRERLEVEQALSVHAASSPQFREALRRDPMSAVKTLLGADADLGGIDVEVVEMPASSLRVSIPSLRAGELEEEELEAVAGGTGSLLDFRLQQSMEQQSRSIQMISNVMKAQSDTQKAIIDNLRG